SHCHLQKRLAVTSERWNQFAEHDLRCSNRVTLPTASVAHPRKIVTVKQLLFPVSGFSRRLRGSWTTHATNGLPNSKPRTQSFDGALRNWSIRSRRFCSGVSVPRLKRPLAKVLRLIAAARSIVNTRAFFGPSRLQERRSSS